MMKGWTVVGISGVTNGGKSSIASKLNELIPNSIIIKQDDYFLPIEDPRHVWVEELGHINWELLTSLNIEKMVCDINNILKNESEEHKYLLVDGFLLFNDPRTLALCEYKFYFDIDYEECKRRRSKREYDPPDVPGYFDKVVWPEAIKSKQNILDNVKDVVFLNGKLPSETLLSTVLKHLNLNH